MLVIQLFKNYLLSGYSVLGIGLDPGDIMKKIPFLVKHAISRAEIAV